MPAGMALTQLPMVLSPLSNAMAWEGDALCPAARAGIWRRQISSGIMS